MFTLNSDDEVAATVPPNVTMSLGATSGTFTITTLTATGCPRCTSCLIRKQFSDSGGLNGERRPQIARSQLVLPCLRMSKSQSGSICGKILDIRTKRLKPVRQSIV